jgi:putative transposase
VRVAFVLDCHDREVIGWTATTADISGEMLRDMMTECVERRFQAPRTPYRLQWLTDNGSIYAAAKTVDIALALGLDPCFTPVAPASLPVDAVPYMFTSSGRRIHPPTRVRRA